jgi:hypothetical protein
MFNLFDELFAPGRKHTEDERNRLELTREDEGSSDPARGPIDLASGTVTVRAPRRSEENAPGGASAEADGEPDAGAEPDAG